MLSYVLLPFIGFAIAMLVVSIGGGGGSLYVGVLTAFLGVSPAVAVTTSLATGILTTAAGTYSHWREGNVNWKLGGIMLVSGVIAAVAGSLISNALPEYVYTKVTGVVLLGMAVQMVIAYIRRRRYGARQPNAAPTRADGIRAVVFGLIGGLLSGVVGLSGGVPIVAGLMVLGCSSLETVGTSVFVLCGMAVASFAMHVSTGQVDWMLVLLLASGTVLGAISAPKLLARVDKGKLELILQPVMMGLCTLMGVLLVVR